MSQDSALRNATVDPELPPSVRSMTGQGHATLQGPLGTVTVEVRTVNNRGFKCSPRLSETLSTLEPKIESLTRRRIHRGSVYMNVGWRKPPGEDVPNIDQDVLRAYIQQLRESLPPDAPQISLDIGSLVALPGVVVARREDHRDDPELWQFVQQAIENAIDNLDEMRAAEGRRMAESLQSDSRSVAERLQAIRQLAPRTVENYRERLEGKIQRLLQKHEIEVQTVDLLREVQIFADRADISEEITRLDSHLVMFDEVLEGEARDRREPTGRKLDFIIQEMFRETNTIGSKASDAQVSAEVVEIKCAIERMRELVQNLE